MKHSFILSFMSRIGQVCDVVCLSGKAEAYTFEAESMAVRGHKMDTPLGHQTGRKELQDFTQLAKLFSSHKFGTKQQLRSEVEE